MNTHNSAHDRLKAARRSLVLDHPFFGRLALGMALQEEKLGRTHTMGTDGRGVYYDRAFVDSCSDADLVVLFAHEVMHPALLHHTRRGDRDLGLWNDAADYAINLILQEAGFQLPSGMLLNPQYRGMTAEQIYDTLDQTPDDSGSESQSEHPTAAKGPGESDSTVPTGNESQDESGDPETKSGGIAEKPGAVWDAPDPAQQEAEWQVTLRQATQVARMMGRLPGNVALAVEAATKPRIDWRSILRRFVQQTATADYSWRRPNRRYTSSGVYLPELRADSMPAIVVAVDTSGSTEQVLPIFKAELQSIVEECQPEATFVVMADAAVHRMDRFERGEPIEFNVEGLGGTDFRPVFDHVNAEQISPACLIYLTDGYGIFPDEPSEYPTLWAITTPDELAPWGETVTVDILAA